MDPFTVMFPEWGINVPEIRFSSVDFPHPLLPTMAIISLLRTEYEKSENTGLIENEK
jgi:hypothetical protein